jgi:hypothetical protein
MTEQVQQLIDPAAENLSASDAAPEPSPDTGEPAQAPADRPAGVPEKFWDREAGAIRTDALLKSYVELERKLGSMVALPGDDDPEGRERLRRALGVPATVEDYQIAARDELLEPTPEINARLHQAGSRRSRRSWSTIWPPNTCCP